MGRDVNGVLGILLMVTRECRKMGPAEIAATKDENIDLSDIAELDETVWQQAKLVEPDRTE